MFLGGEAKENESIGKKAENLSQLKKEGFPVPSGLSFSQKTYATISDQDLQNAIDQIGGFPVAVRSSGAMEDLADASFAGLYESFLNVQSFAELKQKIQACFDSAGSDRVQTYLKEKNIEVPQDILTEGVSVLVQKMVEAKYAGVAFSLNPINGKDEEVLIEYIEGLGEELVSGTKTPTTLTLNRFEERLPEAPLPESFQTLLEYVLKIQAYYGSPQDVEWAINGNGEVFILQSRPITKVQWRTDMGEFTNADFKDGGVSARVCTAFMYSLYESSIKKSMQRYFEKIGLIGDKQARTWITYTYGRPYWSSGEVKKLLLQVPGFDEKEFDQDLGIQKEYGPDGPQSVPYSPKVLLKALPVLSKLKKEYRESQKVAEEFEQNFEREDRHWRGRIQTFPTLSDQEVFDDFPQMIEDFYLKTEPSYFRLIYNNSNYQSDLKALLSEIEKKTSSTFSYINLIDHIEGIPHLLIQEDLKKLKILKQQNPEGYIAAKHEFLSRHYHHSQVELDLTVPRWGEDPRVVDKLVDETSPHHPERENLFFKERQKVIEAMNRQPLLKFKKKRFLKKLETARRFIFLREKMRTFSTRSYYVIRKYLLEIGQRLFEKTLIHDPNDLFMLKHGEITEYLQGKTSTQELTELIHKRKLYYRGFRSFKAPDDFGRGIVSSRVQTGPKKELHGLACSSGKVKGRAIVITSLDQAENVKEGDILIAPFTDPGWTPLLGRVSGVVTEVGGVLSHAAVISREYGIPAILNVNGATESIPTGTQILIDGDRGIVQLLDES